MAKTKTIKLSDVKLHPISSCAGTYLYWYNDKLYRSPKSNTFESFQRTELIKNKHLQSFTKENGLIFEADEQKLPVYRHKHCPHRVRIQESPPEKVKEFILAIISLNVEVILQNMIILDIHEGNVNDTVDGIKWLDMDAFGLASKDNCLASFVRLSYFVYKYLYKNYNGNHEGFSITQIQNIKTDLTELVNCDWHDSASWLKLAQIVQKIETKVEGGHWFDNYSHTMNLREPALLGIKADNIRLILEELKPKTVTDLACNKGYFSFLAAMYAESVVGVELVEACVDLANQYRKLHSSLPVVFAHKSLTEFIEPKLLEHDRFRSELVMALAIVHHIVPQMTHEQFAQICCDLSTKSILIEDIDTVGTYQKLFAERGFELKKRLPSAPSGRTLSLYQRKEN